MSAVGHWILVNSCSVQGVCVTDSALGAVFMQLDAASSVYSPHHFHLCAQIPEGYSAKMTETLSSFLCCSRGTQTNRHAYILQLSSHTLHGTERYWPSVPKPKPEQNNSVDDSWAAAVGIPSASQTACAQQLQQCAPMSHPEPGGLSCSASIPAFQDVLYFFPLVFSLPFSHIVSSFM